MGLLGQWALNPFSKPVRPWNDLTGPDQTRGALNQLTKNLSGHDADASLHLVTTTTASVSTVATTIYPAASGQVRAIVAGSNGSASFQDEIAYVAAGTVQTIHSTTTLGAPATRTYTLATGALQLAMSAGTYSIQVVPILFT